MRWAIAISLFFHLAALALVFRNPGAGERKYPSVMMVRLSSPPPARGVEDPAAVQKAVEQPKAKQQKVQKAAENTRVAEVNKAKKPKKQEKPKPEPAKEETMDRNSQETKSRGLPDGVDLGSEFGSARLDAAGFDSPYYLNILFSKIRNQWDNPFEGTEKTQCTIYFVISREGRIIDSAIETSSGIAAYDQSALRAVLASKPPPLPNQFELDELGIHLEFRYTPGL